MVSDLVNQAVDSTIGETFKSHPDIVNYLRGHSKKHTLIENLCKEINLAGLQANVKLTASNIQKIVEDFTKMFAHAALSQKENEIHASRDAKVSGALKGD